MSPGTDRITVPTNGRSRHPDPDPDPAVPGAPEPAPTASTGPFSPMQLAVGFGILASVVAILVGRMRRRGRGGRRGPFGRG